MKKILKILRSKFSFFFTNFKKLFKLVDFKKFLSVILNHKKNQSK